MRKPLFVWQFLGFVFTGIAGVLLHFLFDWSGKSAIVAMFSAVNESIWEHMKLLFFPMFAFSLVERKSAQFKDNNNFWCVKRTGIIFGLILIPVLYYTINGAFGTMPDWVNIAIFFVAVASGYLLESYLFMHNGVICKSPQTALSVLWIVALVFVVFTFFPPQIPLFEDASTNRINFERLLRDFESVARGVG